MSGSTPCPDSDRLKGLLDSDLTDDEQARLIGHLDECPGCQQSLEGLAAGGSTDVKALRHIDRDRPAATSQFWPALQRLEHGAATQITPPPTIDWGPDSTPEELSLDFLQPAESPEYLGRLGHFDIMEVVGRGGMGIVLKAYDGCLQRLVAIKVLDPKLANNKLARDRFCREARAAAKVSHANVVATLQVEHEEANDLPYIVMELVAGASLQERLDRHGALPLREVVLIGMKVAAGLAAAHAQGLVHRDIKPANILLEGVGDEQSDGGPPRSVLAVNVKITDFGLARAAEDVKLTQTGFVAGTPLYMAPEQAKGETIDHRADLFSLGSVLYAMAAGKPPFEGNTPFVILKSLTEERPRPIREINPDIPEWLVAIIDKLHAKNPADRFQSASEVAELLVQRLAQLHFSTEVPAAPCPPCGRGKLWVLAVAGPLMLLGGLFLTEWSGLTHLTPAFRAQAPLPEVVAEEPSPEPRTVIHAGAGPIWSLAFSPDSGTLALAIDNGRVKLWDLKAGRFKTTLPAHEGTVWSVAFSPDGKYLATGSSDGAKVWDLNARPIHEHLAFDQDGPVRALAFDRTGKRLAAATRNRVVIWDLISGKTVVKAEGHRGDVRAVSFAPDGSTVASASHDETVKLWDAANGQERLTLTGHRSGVYAVAFDPVGKRLASAGWDHLIRLWDCASGENLITFDGHAEDIWDLAFSPDGRRLASVSEDRTVKLWETDTAGPRLAFTFRGHTGRVYAVAFAPDGQTLASAGRDGTVRLWDVK